MDESTIPTRASRIRLLAKIALTVAFLFFVFGILLMPGPGSSLGMPWPVFFCTFGIMFLAAFISLLGYTACKVRGEPISAFYIVCPVLLFLALLFLLNFRDIIHTLIRYDKALR